MRFQIGDRVRHAIGTGIVLGVDDTDATLRIDFGGERIFWARQRECSLCDAITFALDEQVNWDERRDWWHEVAPIYQAGHSQVHCTPRILVSSYVAWDCELARVDAPPLTVEAEGDAAITCDLPHYPWQRFGAFGRWDNSFIDHISAARWYRVEHGQLSNVSQCVVTL